MNTLQINSGMIKIAIRRDNEPEDFIEFNPSDVYFAEKFYLLIDEFEAKLVEFEKRTKAMDENAALDENKIPANVGERIEFLKEACAYMREKIDYLFGECTSQKVFGNSLNLEVFEQFFEGITPFIKTARTEKLKKYTSNKLAGRVMG